MEKWDELVFTTITKEAFPLVRYRTRDISRLIAEPCRCGRSHIRMDRVTGRSDDMLINVFRHRLRLCSRVSKASRRITSLSYKAGIMDTLEVQVEVSERAFADADEVRYLQRLEKSLSKDLRDYSV